VFSFIKSIQNLLSELKKKKGLWFTTLTLLAISGIVLSMYLLTSMTKSVGKEVYLNMSTVYKSSLELKLEDKQTSFKKLVLGLKINDVFKNNLNNKTLIDPLITEYNNSLTEAGFSSTSLVFYSTVNQTNQYRNSINTTINRKSPLFGIEVLPSGPTIVYLEPILDGENVLGVVEVKENILALKRDIERNRQGIFLFLLEERMLANININAKNGNYRTIVNDLKVEEQNYDGQFFSNILTEGKDGFTKLETAGYSVNEEYFKTSKQVVDINGVIIGYIILGEKVEGSGAFVNIVDNMTKTVTTVALGLVISILLFMF